MNDTVRRIERNAFYWCESLEFVRLSTNLEYIGFRAFICCYSLTSIFIPPSCREIGHWAFESCKELIILSVPRHTDLGVHVIGGTALIAASDFETDRRGDYDRVVNDEVNEWIKSINNDEKFALHRVCASFQPTLQMIVDIMKEKGVLTTFKVENSIGITPSQYLKENPYAEVTEKAIIENYILQMMGEH